MMVEIAICSSRVVSEESNVFHAGAAEESVSTIKMLDGNRGPRINKRSAATPIKYCFSLREREFGEKC
ncbi:hypothetical protein Bhyg_16689 [Pseudolycoriella hygida]|uniref:Uncharacterized protein n=1 Tax=Pseudolycoriella hygida TaxID=35572 RepID=A0A9Q0RUC7_9DIPT|nr:hypothetical protein Bhyg_16689 [Pseudolycoriella hygida]